MKNKIILFFFSTIYIIISFYSIVEISLHKKIDYGFESIQDYLDILSLFSTHFVGGIFFATGVYCYLRVPNSLLVRNFFYLLYITGLSISLSKASSLNILILKDIEIISLSFAPYLLLNLFRLFPTTINHPLYRKLMMGVLYLGCLNALFYVISLFSKEVINFLSMSLVINIIFSLLICGILIYRHIQFNSDKVKNQLYILIWSFIISFSPVLILSLIPGSLYRYSFVPFELTINTIALFPLALAYILTKQEIIDFQLNFKFIGYKVLLVLLVIGIGNGILVAQYEIDMAQLLFTDFTLVFLIVIYLFLEKLLNLNNLKKITLFKKELQKDKLLIQKLILEDSYLTTCAKLIIEMTHKIVIINGACITQYINNEWVYLHKSGIFSNKEEIHIDFSFLTSCKKYDNYYKINNFIILPLVDDTRILGCIIIGNKINQTHFTRNELELLNEIKIDCLELFINSHAINNIEQKISKEERHSSMLNMSLIDALELEKKNLSAILHDDFLQSLILLSNKLEEETLSGNINVLTYNEFYQSLNNIINTTRMMCYNLYPVIVEDLGLHISLETLRTNAEKNHDILVDVIYELGFKVISKSLSIQIFNIIRELLNNSIKHSQSKKIIIHLKQVEDLYIKVEDFGTGFEYNKVNYLKNNNLGLITIQKRVKQLNGTFNIYSKLNQGTSIVITIPNEWGEFYDNTGIIG